jgi:hypothetical protein
LDRDVLQEATMRSLSKLQSLFATAIGLTACTAGVDRSALGQDTCSGAATYDPLAGVTPTTPVDYMELRVSYGLSTSTPNVVSKSGTVCATATDPATCNATLAAVASPDGWVPARGGGNAASSTAYLVYTRGDEVGTVTSYDALKAFLAPIDDLQDAALLVSQNPDIQHRIVCGPNTGGAAVDGGYEVVANTGDTCGAGTHLDEELVVVSTSGDVTVRQDVVLQQGNPNCVSGRRPEGLVPASRHCADAVGAFFAEGAHLEAASVVAFERLAGELRAHGAPLRLVRAAERSRADEIRHAKVTTALARRYGAEPEAVVVEERAIRPLLEIALENAVEGCVRETFGALVATHQSRHATDARIASAMRRIAEDETRHAALAWDVAEWLDSRLTEAERRGVATVRELAAKAMRRELGMPVAPELADKAGMPRAERAVALFDAIAPELWAAHSRQTQGARA